MNKTASTLIVLLLFAGTAIAAPVTERADFGDKQFGLEPNPPAPTVPEAEVPDDSLGAILEMVVENAEIGDTFAYPVGTGSVTHEIEADGALLTKVRNGAYTRTLELPAQPDATDHNFTAIITPATISIDRVQCDNTGVARSGDDNTAANKCDATMAITGLVDSITNLADDDTPSVTNPASVAKPDAATVTANFQRLLPIDIEELPLSMVMVDPDDALKVGPLADHYTGVPATEDVYTTKAEIESAINIQAVTSLDLNSVLDDLKVSSKNLGAVDVDSLSTIMADRAIGFRVITNAVSDPMTVLDTDAAELVLVDGGLGRISLLGDDKRLIIDNDKLTALKDPESAKDTVFHSFTDHPDAIATTGRLSMHPELGSYQSVVDRAKEAIVLGLDTNVAKDKLGCRDNIKERLVDKENSNALCVQPGFSAIDRFDARALAENVDVDPTSYLSTFRGLGTDRRLAAAERLDQVPDLSVPMGQGVPVGIASFDLPDTGRFSPGAFTLPDAGLGSVEGLPSPDPEANPLPCTGSCVPDYDPTVLDVVYEAFQAGTLNSVMPLVPTNQATQIASVVGDASGSALAMAPWDKLQDLAPGAMSEVILRTVGAEGSILPGQAISNAKVQLDYTDPLGLSQSSQVYETNSNGYAVAAIPALSDWQATITKEGFEKVTGAGQSPAPGGESGQEFEMRSNDENAVKAAASDYGSLIIIALAVLVVGYLWWRNRK